MNTLSDSHYQCIKSASEKNRNIAYRLNVVNLLYTVNMQFSKCRPWGGGGGGGGAFVLDCCFGSHFLKAYILTVGAYNRCICFLSCSIIFSMSD